MTPARPRTERTFIVTRPDEDNARFIAAARAAGAECLRSPLMRIVFDANASIPELPWQAVAVTSANGARAIARHPARARLIRARAVTVGPASTRAAREAGFTDVLQAERGDVTGVIALIRERLDPAAGPILYASGRVTRGDLEGDLSAAGFTVVRRALYDAERARELSDAVKTFLSRGGVATVALYSPRSARIWAALCVEAGVREKARAQHYACLSDNVAEALIEDLGSPARIMVSPARHESALLTMLGLPITP